MLQLTPQMRILVALDPIDGRKGIDSLVQLCRQKLQDDPFSGCVFLFRTRGGSVIKLLAYDGQGFWLAQKRLSTGRFKWWPQGSGPSLAVESYQAQMLLAAGDPSVRAAPAWKPLHPIEMSEGRKSPQAVRGSLPA